MVLWRSGGEREELTTGKGVTGTVTEAGGEGGMASKEISRTEELEWELEGRSGKS